MQDGISRPLKSKPFFAADLCALTLREGLCGKYSRRANAGKRMCEKQGRRVCVCVHTLHYVLSVYTDFTCVDGRQKDAKYRAD